MIKDLARNTGRRHAENLLRLGKEVESFDAQAYGQKCLSENIILTREYHSSFIVHYVEGFQEFCESWRRRTLVNALLEILAREGKKQSEDISWVGVMEGNEVVSSQSWEEFSKIAADLSPAAILKLPYGFVIVGATWWLRWDKWQDGDYEDIHEWRFFEVPPFLEGKPFILQD